MEIITHLENMSVMHLVLVPLADSFFIYLLQSAKFTSPDESSTVSPYEVYPSPAPGRHVRPQSALGIPVNRNNLASVLRIQSSRYNNNLISI
jgi:hypothetical protein